MSGYELRREAVMREARSYVGGKFMPQSADDLFDIVNAGTRESGFVLQVYGYWDMVARWPALVETWLGTIKIIPE